MRISAVTMSCSTSVIMTGFVYYFFWWTGEGHGHQNMTGLFTPQRVGSNLVWVVMAYSFIQIPVASLIQFSRHRWAGPAAVIVLSFFPIVFLAIAMSNFNGVIKTIPRTEIWTQLFVLTLGQAIIMIVFILIVNGRFGFLAGSADQSSDHHHGS